MTVSHVIPGKAWHIPVSPSIPYDLAYAGLGGFVYFFTVNGIHQKYLLQMQREADFSPSETPKSVDEDRKGIQQAGWGYSQTEKSSTVSTRRLQYFFTFALFPFSSFSGTLSIVNGLAVLQINTFPVEYCCSKNM